MTLLLVICLHVVEMDTQLDNVGINDEWTFSSNTMPLAIYITNDSNSNACQWEFVELYEAVLA